MTHVHLFQQEKVTRGVPGVLQKAALKILLTIVKREYEEPCHSFAYEDLKRRG